MHCLALWMLVGAWVASLITHRPVFLLGVSVLEDLQQKQLPYISRDPTSPEGFISFNSLV
jgi:hypothetical protein